MGGVLKSFPLLLGEVGGNGYHCAFAVEVVFVHYQLHLVEVGCEDLFGVEGLGLALVFDIEGYFVAFGSAFAGAELFLGSEEGVVSSESEEAGGVGDGVFPVGLDFDMSCLSDLSFVGSVADDAGGLPEVGLVGDDLDASSFSDCYFAGEAAQVDSDGNCHLLLVH